MDATTNETPEMNPINATPGAGGLQALMKKAGFGTRRETMNFLILAAILLVVFQIGRASCRERV